MNNWHAFVIKIYASVWKIKIILVTYKQYYVYFEDHLINSSTQLYILAILEFFDYKKNDLLLVDYKIVRTYTCVVIYSCDYEFEYHNSPNGQRVGIRCESSTFNTQFWLIREHYVYRQHARFGRHCGLGMCLIHESHDLASMGQYDFRVEVLIKV